MLKNDQLKSYFLDLPSENPFKALSFEEFLDVVSSLELKRFKPGQKIFSADEKAIGIFQIFSGIAKVAQKYGQSTVTLRFIGSGDWAGHRSVFTSQLYKGTATAKTAVLAFFVPKDRLHQLVLNYKFAEKLIKLICQELEKSEKTINDYQNLSVSARILSLLKNMNDKFGIDYGQDSRLITTKISRIEISNIVGSSEEAVSRQISKWKKEGLLSEQDKRLCLTNRFLNRVTR